MRKKFHYPTPTIYRMRGDSKAPNIPLYDEMTDPYDHLDNFHHTMEGGRVNEATKCRMFPTMLKGHAMISFKRLALESIGSFVELRKVFLK
ncbi:unnamed protein product [Prunus armeniaca]